MIKEMPYIRQWTTEESQKLLKENNLELIITNPYIREIPPGRDEILAKNRAYIKELCKQSKNIQVT